MNEKGMNGLINPARPYAISAMIILCLSFMVFFIRFAKIHVQEIFWSRIILISGIISMLFAILIFTEYHDLMTMVSSFFGLFAVIGIIRSIYKSPLFYYKTTGVICLILLAMNNYIYYSTHWIEGLPFLQKITFVVVLLWVIGLNYQIDRNQSKLTI